MKKIFTLFAALTMVMSMFAAGTNPAKLYMKGEWQTDNAWFAAYFFGNGETWVKMEHVGFGYYVCETPQDKAYKNVIFVRMNGSKKDLNWSSKWDQTADLTLSADKNCYYVKYEQNDSKNKGEWGTYTEPTSLWIKHDWDAKGWIWKEAQKNEDGTYSLTDYYGGSGCNYNSVNNDNGSVWVEKPTTVNNPAKGDYSLFRVNPAESSITITAFETITLSYDITAENISNRQGDRQTISVEDENYGNPQLVIPGFNEEVAEYTGAFLSINDTTLNATVTYTKEDGKEIYAATAMDGSTVTIYNVTFTYVLPTTQNYELYAMSISATVESEEGFTTYYLKGNAILGEEYVPVEFMLDNTGYAEGTIGEVFAVGTGEAEQEGTSLYGAVLLQDESGNTYRIEFTAEVEQPEVEIVVKEEVNVALYKLTVDVQGTMAMVSAGTEELSFWLTLLQTENHYGDYMNDDFSNIWYGDEQLYAAYGEKHTYGVTDGKVNFVVSFITSPDAEGNVTKYNFTLYAGEKPSDPTALDNLNTSVAPVKMIENGQLIIINNGVQYNAQGAILK